MRRRRGERAALLRHGVRGRARSCATATRPRRPSTRPRAASSAITWPRRWPNSTTSTSKRPASGDLARHDGYIERQLRRWRTQYEQMHVEGVDHGGLIEAVGDELRAQIPAPTARLGRARRLPPRQHGARPRRQRTRHPRLGDLHARRSDGRPRTAARLLGRAVGSDGGAVRRRTDDGAGLRQS